MKLRRWAAGLTGIAAMSLGTMVQVAAQTPGALYTWDHAFGVSAGSNLEGWSGGGTNVPTLDNDTDGVLSIVESAAGGDWEIAESFNIIKESAVRDDFSETGYFDFGGLDLTGLDGIEVDLGHDGANPINGQLFVQGDDGGGCCSFQAAGFTIDPGSAQTISLDFDTAGVSDAQQKYIRSMGIQMFGNSEPAPLTWNVSEVRSVGDRLNERVIADHTGGGLENAVVKFDNLGINGAPSADNQNGLSNLDGTLRWVDFGGTGEAGDESGGAVAWGNNNALAVDYLSRPLDLSGYNFAVVRMKATPGMDAASEVGVQFYTQYANRATPDEFAFQSTDLTLPADGEFHDLAFPLDSFTDMDLTQWIGVNLHPHAGGSLQVQIESVILRVPEPATGWMLFVGVCLAGCSRRQMRSFGPRSLAGEVG